MVVSVVKASTNGSMVAVTKGNFTKERDKAEEHGKEVMEMYFKASMMKI